MWEKNWENKNVVDVEIWTENFVRNVTEFFLTGDWKEMSFALKAVFGVF